MPPYSHDPDFIAELAERQRMRKHAHLNDRVSHVCELVQFYRGLCGWENDHRFASVAQLPLRTVQRLTAKSLDFDELTAQLVEKLARVLRLPATIIVSSGHFTLGDLANRPEEEMVSGRQRRRRNRKQRRRTNPIPIDRRQA